MSIKFGPSGNGEIFYKMGYKKSVEAPKFLKNFGRPYCNLFVCVL